MNKAATKHLHVQSGKSIVYNPPSSPETLRKLENDFGYVFSSPEKNNSRQLKLFLMDAVVSQSNHIKSGKSSKTFIKSYATQIYTKVNSFNSGMCKDLMNSLLKIQMNDIFSAVNIGTMQLEQERTIVKGQAIDCMRKVEDLEKFYKLKVEITVDKKAAQTLSQYGCGSQNSNFFCTFCDIRCVEKHCNIGFERMVGNVISFCAKATQHGGHGGEKNEKITCAK